MNYSGMPAKPVFDAVVLDALKASTEERREQSQRLWETTRDVRAFDDYARAVRYYDQILDLIEAHRGR